MPRTSLLTMVVLAAVLLAGCQKAPTEQVAAAQNALDEARSVEADRYAPDEFAQAQRSFSEATTEIATQEKNFVLARNFGKAEQSLKDAVARAQAAQTAAKDNKEKMKQEVEVLTTEAEAALQTAKAALLKAPRGKDTKAELEAMKADLDATSTALAEAKDMYAKGDYFGAKASLTQSKEKATEVSKEVELAMQKVKGGTKRP